MKTPSDPLHLAGPVALLALFVGGSAAGRMLAFPLAPALVGLGLVLLALRIAVMFAAAADAPRLPVARAERGSDGRAPALRAANG